MKCPHQRLCLLVCPRCSGEHSIEKCKIPKYNPDNTLNANDYKCRNCGQNHSSAYKGCPKYLESQQAMVIKTKEGISYSEALKKIKPTSESEINRKSVVIATKTIPINQPREEILKLVPLETNKHSNNKTTQHNSTMEVTNEVNEQGEIEELLVQFLASLSKYTSLERVINKTLNILNKKEYCTTTKEPTEFNQVCKETNNKPLPS